MIGSGLVSWQAQCGAMNMYLQLLGERAALSPCAYLNTTPAAAAPAAAVSLSLWLQLL